MTVMPLETTILDPDNVVPEKERDEDPPLLEAEADTMPLEEGTALEDPPKLIVCPLAKELPEMVTPALEELCATACVAMAAMTRARFEKCMIDATRAIDWCESEGGGVLEAELQVSTMTSHGIATAWKPTFLQY